MEKPWDGQEREAVVDRALSFARLRMAMVIGAGDLLLRLTPFLSVLAVFLVLSWFGWFREIPDWARIGSLAALLLAAVASLWPLLGLRPATRREIDRQLESQNRIGHQAIAAQDDTIGNADPFARALWIEHQRRLARAIGPLATGIPQTDLPARDPFGLRVGLALLLVTAFAYSHSGSAGRLSDAFSRHGLTGLGDVRIDAWISPPAYVNLPPVFLTGVARMPETEAQAIEGSEITVRLGGADTGATVIWLGESGGKPLDLAASADPGPGTSVPGGTTTFTFRPQTGGTLEVAAGAARHVWPIVLVPDNPPEARFTGEPRRALNGALELDYALLDDHGLSRAQAEIVPASQPAAGSRPLYDAPQYRLTLPRRDSEDGRATASHDLTEHPLAGQKVRITIVVSDGAGQTGRSETIETILPGRRFSEPLAAAVVEERNVVALNANDLPRALELNEALMIAPEETIPNLTHFLLLQSVHGRLENARTEEDLRAAVDYLWGVALQIEGGDLSFAERRLREAERALSEALERGSGDEEIAALMDELRKAMQEYLDAVARLQQDNPEGAADRREAQNILRQRDLENLMDQIENLARSGAREQAMEMLSELQRMMNNLQAGRQQRQQQQGGPMRQQMDKLGELLRQQQQLMDQTFRLDRDKRAEPGQEEGGEGDSRTDRGNGEQEGLPSGEAEKLGQAQQELRDALKQLQKDLEGLGVDPSKGFGEAGQAMGDAAGNLNKGDTGRALGDQERALQALRQGAEDMMNQMMQAMGSEQGEAEGQGPARSGRRAGDDRDPLGRPRATTGPDFGGRVKIPDEIDIQRAREILDAIRKRLEDRLSPEAEQRYLERLLELR